MIPPVCGSLFSSVGGMDIGLSRAGFKHAFFCEADEWRRSILARHWPGVPIHHDVRAVAREHSESPEGSRVGDGTGGELRPGRVDLIAGGFPCQDLSVAGRRRGLAGERSGLFYEFARIADELVRPGGWILIENVLGLLSSHNGRDFGIVLATLAEIGFMDGAWRVLDAQHFGVPQRRRRVFILARRARGDRAREVLLEPEGGRWDLAPGYEARAQAAAGAGGGAYVAGSPSRRYGKGVNTTVDDGAIVVSRMPSTNHGGWRIGAEEAAGGALVVAALDRGQGGPDDSAQGGHLTAHTGGVRRLTPTECERLMGWPDGWTEPGSDSKRYAACGDGVVSYVAEWIGRRLRYELESI